MRFLPFVALVLLCSAAFAADVSFEGSLEADYGNYLEKDFKVNNAANHDLRLKMNIDLDENVRAVVGTASKSMIPGGDFSRIRHSILRNEATPISSDEDRWTPFVFDGISLEWTVSRDLTFIFGDLFYSFGAFNYYYWRNPDYNAAVLTTQGMRGLGVRFGSEGYLYVGASDANDKSGRIAASYAIPIPGLNQVNNKFTIAPMLDLNKGGGRDHRYTFGIDANYSRSHTELNYAIRGMWGIHPRHGSYVNTFTVEPSFNYNSFNLASTCYFALLSDTDEGKDPLTVNETYASDERLIYVEPSYSFNRKFSLGFGFEWHKPGSDTEDWFLLAPTGYIYPTAGMALSFWLGYTIKEGYNNPGFGISSSVQF
uniref:Uncharacterized protein n=1 Tax=uncultured bacterium contig00092 TaxID=1181563 RepID=A0A806KSN7_9BACT|nr:hypothetical protein [uncultured bacterium contig00092]